MQEGEQAVQSGGLRVVCRWLIIIMLHCAACAARAARAATVADTVGAFAVDATVAVASRPGDRSPVRAVVRSL